MTDTPRQHPLDGLVPYLAGATAVIKILFRPDQVVKLYGLRSNTPGKTRGEAEYAVSHFARRPQIRGAE